MKSTNPKTLKAYHLLVGLIKAQRLALGISQLKLAAEIGRSEIQIIRIEKSQNFASADYLIEVCEALNLEITINPKKA